MGPDGQGNRTRSEPSSVSTASPMESIAPGGEVQFVQQRIIESSLELQSRVRLVVSVGFPTFPDEYRTRVQTLRRHRARSLSL
jgi:RNA methyltransferase